MSDDKHPSMSETVWRRGWNDAKRGWTDWRFVIADVVALPTLAVLVNVWAALVVAALSLVMVWVGATTSAPLKQRNEERRYTASLQAKETASPATSAIEELANQAYYIGGERTCADQLFLELAPSFRQAITEYSLEINFYLRFGDYNKAHPEKPVSGQNSNMMAKIEASSVLNDWFTAGLVKRETVQTPGAQPTSSGGMYVSQHTGPQIGSVYSLSELGLTVYQHLKKLPILPSLSKAESQQRSAS